MSYCELNQGGKAIKVLICCLITPRNNNTNLIYSRNYDLPSKLKKKKNSKNALNNLGRSFDKSAPFLNACLSRSCTSHALKLLKSFYIIVFNVKNVVPSEIFIFLNVPLIAVWTSPRRNLVSTILYAIY